MNNTSLQNHAEMAREIYQRAPSSPSVLLRGPFTPPTTIPPSLNRANSHTSRQGYRAAISGGATTMLTRVASSSSSRPWKSTPRNSPPASPPQSPIRDSEIHWDVVRRRLSDGCDSMFELLQCHARYHMLTLDTSDGYVSFPDFDCAQSSASSSTSEKSNSDTSSIDR